MEKRHFVADFETTFNHDNTASRVWLFDICPVEPDADGNYKHYHGFSIAQFINGCMKNPGVYWFHNLAFDGSYIVDFLLRTGWTYCDDLKGRKSKAFTILVSDMGQWYTIKCIGRTWRQQFEFRDSLKKIPLPVKRIAKAYDLPMAKGEIDYKLDRWDYGPDDVTPEELEYVKHDTEIVARALKFHFDNGMEKLTIAGDALAEFRTTITEDEWKQKILAGDFYKTSSEDEYNIRLSYCGGISWVNPDIKPYDDITPVLYDGRTYDYNSMYPSVMLMYPMPLGRPYKGSKWSTYPMWINRAKVKAKRKENYPACLRVPEGRYWLEDTEEYWEGYITVTSVDYEIINRCYDVEWHFDRDGYGWEGEKGIFDKYIEHWSQVKRTSKGGRRQIAKLMLNSLYGKFGAVGERKHKIPWYTDANKVSWTTSEPEQGDVYNVAISSFITAYARRELVTAILNIDGLFCYCDTDSVHFCRDNGKLEFKGRVHDTDFGAWKMESEWTRAKFLRQKTYCEEIKNPDGSVTLDVKACGCNDAAKAYVTFDNFELGLRVPGKLMKKTIVGGAVLVDSYFTVKAPFKFF